jgi:molybdate transport system substrate-binding protein
VPGIDVIGPMPPGCGIVSTFSAGLCAASTQPEAVRDLIAFMHSPEAAEAKRRHGMEPA